MSQVNGKEVTYAVLKEGIFYPGVGPIKGTLTARGDSVNKPAKMVIDEPFLLVQLDDKVGRKVDIAIPLEHVTHLVLSK